MAEQKKYYWLKLKRDFFKRHDIRIIEEMPNGKDYVLFYLKMLLEGIDHGGELRFNETIPYNEQMLSVITNTNIDLVRSAMKMFIKLRMVEILDNETIYMTEVHKMTGTETAWAEQKRLYRGKEQGDNPRTLSSPCPHDIRQEKEIDTEIEKEESIGASAPAPSGSKRITRTKYGEFGWVKLFEEEHTRLMADLGADELSRCIVYVDESAQATGNKNRWKDWNLVLRRCSRDKWGLKSPGNQYKKAEPKREYVDTNGSWDESEKLHSKFNGTVV